MEKVHISRLESGRFTYEHFPMKNVATVHILWFLPEGDSLLEAYRKEALKTLIMIKPDIVVVCGKRRGDVASHDEAKRMTEYLQTYYPEPSYFTQPQAVTVLEVLELNKKLFAALGEIDHVHIVSSNIQFYLLLFMAIGHYAESVGYNKSQHETNQAIIDIFKSKSKTELANIAKMCLGKFCFYPIEQKRWSENYIYQMATTLRELVCSQDPDIAQEYSQWRKDLRGVKR